MTPRVAARNDEYQELGFAERTHDNGGPAHPSPRVAQPLSLTPRTAPAATRGCLDLPAPNRPRDPPAREVHARLPQARTGARPPKAELREERDQAIRDAYQAGLLTADIGKVVGLTHQRVSNIIRRKR